MAEIAPNGNRERAQDVKTAACVFIGVGAAAALGGLIWLTQRSREPRVTGTRIAKGASAVYGRHDTLLGDVALLGARDAGAIALPPAVMPLHLRFTF